MPILQYSVINFLLNPYLYIIFLIMMECSFSESCVGEFVVICSVLQTYCTTVCSISQSQPLPHHGLTGTHTGQWNLWFIHFLSLIFRIPTIHHNVGEHIIWKPKNYSEEHRNVRTQLHWTKAESVTAFTGVYFKAIVLRTAQHHSRHKICFLLCCQHLKK